MKAFYTIIAITCAFLVSAQGRGATITAVGNGNWTTNSVWSCNCQPSDSDNIVIPSGRTVTVGGIILLAFGPVINITIGGTLTLNNASLAIDASDVVNILSGGKITGSGFFGGSVFSGFSPVIVSNGSEIDGPQTITNGVLPIKLIFFKGTTADDGILLEWASSEEKNFDHYELAVSSDGKSFASIATIPGKDANGAGYNFLDTYPPATTNYYKLTAIDRDGSREEMQVIKCEWTDRRDRITIYPNPVTDGTIHVRFFGGGNGSLRLMDCNGLAIVGCQVVNAFSSDLQLPPTTTPGVYFLSAEIDGRISRSKVIVK